MAQQVRFAVIPAQKPVTFLCFTTLGGLTSMFHSHPSTKARMAQQVLNVHNHLSTKASKICVLQMAQQVRVAVIPAQKAVKSLCFRMAQQVLNVRNHSSTKGSEALVLQIAQQVRFTIILAQKAVKSLCFKWRNK